MSDLLAKLRKQGASLHEAVNKVHYRRRCFFERAAMTEAIKVLEGMGESIVAYECDGIVVAPSLRSVDELVEAIGRGWQYKPYRTQKELIKYLETEKGYDMSLDVEKDSNGNDWFEREKDLLIIEKRIVSGEVYVLSYFCFV